MIKFVVSTAGALGGIAAVVALVLSILGSGSATSSGPATPTGQRQGAHTTSMASTSSQGLYSSSASLSIGTCLSDTNTTTSCDAPHRKEIYAISASCDQPGLLMYMGGQSQLDVLLPSVTPAVLRLGGESYCVLPSLADEQLSGSMRNVLDTPAGDRWRRCRDNRFPRETPCSEPHTDEFVFSSVLQPGQHLDCGSRSFDYLGSALSAFAGQLTVRSGSQGNVQQCLVEVLGDNLLTKSLRRNGTAALPIESAP